MNRPCLMLPLLLLAMPAAAQETEAIARVSLGLMQFGGPDAAATSHLNYSGANGLGSGYTNSPYGSLTGAGYGIGGRGQQVTSWNGLLAFDVGYDCLRTRTGITTVDYFDGRSNTAHPATGTTSLQTQHLAAFLGLGYRVVLPAVDIDLLAGPELAYVYSFHETGSGTFDGATDWKVSYDRPQSTVDPRLRADVTIWRHRFGLNASYSHGLANYQAGLVGGSYEVHARILRLGAAFRIR